jgi:hypothetical protein
VRQGVTGTEKGGFVYDGVNLAVNGKPVFLYTKGSEG